MPLFFGWALSCPQLYYDSLAHHLSVHILANEIVLEWIEACYSLWDSHLNFLDYNPEVRLMELIAWKLYSNGFFLYRLSHFSYWLCKFPFLPGGYKGSDCTLPVLGPAVPSNSHSNSRITTQSELYLEWVTESNHRSVMLSYGQLRRLWSLETGRCIFSTPFIAGASLGTFWCPWILMDYAGKVQIFSIICWPNQHPSSLGITFSVGF